MAQIEGRDHLGAADARAWTVGRYLVLYREQGDGSEVVRVVHGARRIERIEF
jgi:hypothetical protein